MEYTFFLVFSWWQYRKAIQKNWQKEMKKFEKKNFPPQKVFHLVILATCGESIKILEESIQSITNSNFDKKKIIFCLATEERKKNSGRKNAAIIEKKISKNFKKFFWIEHPKNLPNEIIGKGANISFAAKQVSKKLKQENFDIKKILVTTLDADNRVHPDLFSLLAIKFSTDRKRHQKSFQPIPLFFNNIWSVPILNRMVAISSGFWHLIESGRPDRLRNFSSHSQPLSALIEMNFWDKNTIVEDGRQFFRSYLHFFGNYSVEPIFLPIYQDAAAGENYFRSLVGQYKQLRRWAWGASDIAYFLNGIFKNFKKLPKLKTFLYLWRLIEGHYIWATSAIFLTISHFIWFLNPEFSQTVFSGHFLFLVFWFFKIALVGIFTAMLITFLTLPPPPKFWQSFSILWQWLFFPIMTIFFGSAPALESQIRLALGQKMKFSVTKKIRKTA